MNRCHCDHRTDFGPDVFITNIQEMAEQNKCYRTALWTGCHLQMTLMSIPPCCDIGAELHPDMDQLIRVEKGNAMVMTGNCPHNLNCEQHMCEGDAVFVPAEHGTTSRTQADVRSNCLPFTPHHIIRLELWNTQKRMLKAAFT